MTTPRIWVPKFKIIEPSPIVVSSGLQGRYKLHVRRPDLRVRLETPWFDNLITNQGLNFFGSTNTWASRCAVGTGTAPPDVSDSQLGNQIAVTSTQQSSSTGAQGTEPYYGAWIKTWRFAQGAAAGNLTEVGVGSSSGTPMSVFSRALILDDEGNPTTITVLSDEFLDVTYELRSIPPTDDVNDTIVISGNSYDTVRRAGLVTSINSWNLSGAGNGVQAGLNQAMVLRETQTLGAITSEPSGTQASSSSITNNTYSNDTFERTFSATWNLNAGNFGSGVGCATYRLGQNASAAIGCAFFQTSFNPRLPKNNTMVLTLNGVHRWARASI